MAFDNRTTATRRPRGGGSGGRTSPAVRRVPGNATEDGHPRLGGGSRTICMTPRDRAPAGRGKWGSPELPATERRRSREDPGEAVSRRSHPQRRPLLARRCRQDVAGRGDALRHQGDHPPRPRRRRQHGLATSTPTRSSATSPSTPAIAPVEWRDTKINLVDAPGYADFLGDVKSALRVVDAAIIVMDASAGVEVGTEQAWRLAESAVAAADDLHQQDGPRERRLRARARVRPRGLRQVRSPRSSSRSAARRASRASSICSPSRRMIFHDNHDGGFETVPIPDDLEERVRTRTVANSSRRSPSKTKS